MQPSDDTALRASGRSRWPSARIGDASRRLSTGEVEDESRGVEAQHFRPARAGRIESLPREAVELLPEQYCRDPGRCSLPSVALDRRLQAGLRVPLPPARSPDASLTCPVGPIVRRDRHGGPLRHDPDIPPCQGGWVF